MQGPERCELHEAAVEGGTSEPETIVRWGRTPIGDECQHCSVCRWARTYIERRLAERAGRGHPPGESAEDAWRELQAALRELRAQIHRPS